MRPAFHRQVDPTRVGSTCLWEDDLMHAWNTTHTCMVGTLQFYLHYFPFVVESVLKLLKLFPNGNYMIYLFIDQSGRHASFVHWEWFKVLFNDIYYVRNWTGPAAHDWELWVLWPNKSFNNKWAPLWQKLVAPQKVVHVYFLPKKFALDCFCNVRYEVAQHQPFAGQ